jgi:hypothetical protein
VQWARLVGPAQGRRLGGGRRRESRRTAVEVFTLEFLRLWLSSLGLGHGRRLLLCGGAPKSKPIHHTPPALKLL